MKTAEIRTEPKPFCTLCGQRGHILYSGLKDTLFGTPGSWNLYKCSAPDCGLIWLNPTPCTEDLSKAYTTYYTHDADKESLARKIVKKIYFGISQLPEWCVGLAPARRRMNHLFLDDKFAGRLLDVGCGDGIYLRFMATQGWRVEGLDSDVNAVKRAREVYGLRVQQCSLEEAKYPEDSFDAVTLRHVIEHLPNPIETLKECLRILRPGGRLVIVTPNSESLGHGLAHECWRGLEVPRHLNIFSLTALKRCASLLGYPPGRHSVFTVATGADFILDESLALREKQTSETAPLNTQRRTLHFVRTLHAIALQYKEQLSLKHDLSIGEEGVLILHKQ